MCSSVRLGNRPPMPAPVCWPGVRVIGTADTTGSAVIAALDLAATHRLGIWDSLIISVAAENACRVLLSEDLQDGFIWRGLTVLNPFAVPRSPLLDALLESDT
jgi:hypothetical protein